MSDDIESRLDESLGRGETLALATVLTGARTGRRMLVWSAGHTYGDLGWPRLNQRVALYAEQLFERGTRGDSVKRFAIPGAADVEVRLEFRIGAAR